MSSVSEPAFKARSLAQVETTRGGRAQNSSEYSLHRGRETAAGRWWSKPWLNLVSFLLTLVSTTTFGYALQQSFRASRGLDEKFLATAYEALFHGDAKLLAGLEYSVPLLLILLAHEFGHYIACQRWKVRSQCGQ